MMVRADQLTACTIPVFYLFGEDHDALMEYAQELLAQGNSTTTRMRLNVDELAHFMGAMRSPSLFGPATYSALLGNAFSASAAHIASLLTAITKVELPHRLIICACGAMYKKAWHKEIMARKDIACCEFRSPNTQDFQQWLWYLIEQSKLNISKEDAFLMAAQLNGLRTQSRQWMTRLQYYDGNQGAPISLPVMQTLCGEHSPESLDNWCHATAMRQPQAIQITHHLLFFQGVAPLQMLVWLSNRLQQLLMYCWHQACHHANPLQQARAFGAARKLLPQEARHWNGATLMQALHNIAIAEQQLKGASLLPERIVMESLVLCLCRDDASQS